MIISLIAAAITIALIYGFFVYRHQAKSDQLIIDTLKKDQDVESFRVQVINEKIDGDKRIISHRSTETEILIGRGFLVLTQPVFALYNKEISREGLKGITWAIEISKARIAEDRTLEIDSILPDDETTYTHLIFRGLTDREIQLIEDKRVCLQNN